MWGGHCVRDRLNVLKKIRGGMADACELLAEKASSQWHPVSEVLVAEMLPLLEACRFLEDNAEQILSPVVLGRRGRPWWLGGVVSEIRREPYGVVGVISPSNYPLFIGGVQVLQALAAGNSVVWKPGSGGFRVASEFRRVAVAAGLPEGVLEVCPEDAEAGTVLTLAGIQKLIFTGGFETGVHVLRSLSGSAVSSVMELSGCDAVLVRADADVALAARAISFGLEFNQSRTCMAPRRIFIARGLMESFEKVLLQEIKRGSLEFGNVVSSAQAMDIVRLVGLAVEQGGRVLHGGISSSGMQWPVVVSNASAGMDILNHEIFAPVVTLVPVSSDQEALAGIGRCAYGLSAAIFTSDRAVGEKLSERLNVGTVLVNDLIVPTADPRVPFGGRGRSGFGVTRGAEGLLEMTQVKVVQIRSNGMPRYFQAKPPEAGLTGSLVKMVHGSSWKIRTGGVVDLLRHGIRAMQRNDWFQRKGAKNEN